MAHNPETWTILKKMFWERDSTPINQNISQKNQKLKMQHAEIIDPPENFYIWKTFYPQG